MRYKFYIHDFEYSEMVILNPSAEKTNVGSTEEMCCIDMGVSRSKSTCLLMPEVMGGLACMRSTTGACL
jgi:hypothetical protein